MVTWNTLNRGRVEEIERYHTLEDWIREISLLAWEEPSRHYAEVVTDDNGEVVAVAMFGAELELFISCYDVRQLRFEMPSIYRE